MCYCTPTIRAVFCSGCAPVMYSAIKELEKTNAELKKKNKKLKEKEHKNSFMVTLNELRDMYKFAVENKTQGDERFKVTFTPTGIGTGVVIKPYNGDSGKDVTDYERW